MVKAAVITGPGQVELRQEPYPIPGEDQLLVDVAACGVCTFERRLFSGDKPWYPVAPGHEVAGVVAAAGAGVNGLPGSPQAGDRVTLDLMTRCMTCGPCRRGRTALCRYRQGRTLSDGTFSMGGLTESIAIDAKSAYPVGEAAMAHAAMGEPIACCVHSLRRGGFAPGDRVAIIGGGFMGRLHMALTRIGGAASTGIIDPSTERRTDAARAGADWVAAPEDAVRVGGRQDVVFVAAMGGVDIAVELADAGGTVVLYSSFDPELEIRIGAHRVHRDEVSIVGVYNQEPEDWKETSTILRSGLITTDLDRLITSRYPLSRIGDALSLVVSEPTYRVFVEPDRG
ncbi:MAG: alcohol dehydrogenase catalytic domain-containing protein [bacterium]|nr:alcohol dehydrogenase catalytic domain-containing protein [bacterium]